MTLWLFPNSVLLSIPSNGIGVQTDVLRPLTRNTSISFFSLSLRFTLSLPPHTHYNKYLMARVSTPKWIVKAQLWKAGYNYSEWRAHGHESNRAAISEAKLSFLSYNLSSLSPRLQYFIGPSLHRKIKLECFCIKILISTYCRSKVDVKSQVSRTISSVKCCS